MTPFAIRLAFHGDLPFFLKSKPPRIERKLSERTSIKDVIEACGVPHTEVDLILVNGEAVDFAAILTQDGVVDVYPPNQRAPQFYQKIDCKCSISRSLSLTVTLENLSATFDSSESMSPAIPRPKIDN
jgi:hypothetical protein